MHHPWPWVTVYGMVLWLPFMGFGYLVLDEGKPASAAAAAKRGRALSRVDRNLDTSPFMGRLGGHYPWDDQGSHGDARRSRLSGRFHAVGSASSVAGVLVREGHQTWEGPEVTVHGTWGPSGPACGCRPGRCGYAASRADAENADRRQGHHSWEPAMVTIHGMGSWPAGRTLPQPPCALL